MSAEWQPLESEWSKESLEKLKTEIEDYVPLKELSLNDGVIPYVNILLLGPVGAGKSSFYNTIDSIFRGRISMKARAGSLQESLTKKLRIFPVLSTKGDRNLRFNICDCRGLEDKKGIERDIEAILEGHVPDGYHFNLETPISKDNCHNYLKEPQLKDKIHCVVFVIDATNVTVDSVDTGVDIMTEKVKEKIRELQGLLNQKEIPQLVLMNKIDGFCKKCENDLSEVFEDENVQLGVKQVAETLGLPQLAVLPMQNISCEQGLGIDINIGILALYNLKRILNAADDYLSNFRAELSGDKIFLNYDKIKESK